MAQVFIESSLKQRVLPQMDAGVSALFQILASKIPASSQSTSKQVLGSTSTNEDTAEHARSAALPSLNPQEAHAASLASHGIKVRDFAYESTLPPIAPVRLLPRQIQPGPRPLKRMRRAGEDDNVFSQSPLNDNFGREGTFMKKLKLAREDTEPDLQSSTAPPPARTRGFANLNDYDHSLDSQLIGSQQPSWSQTPLHYDDESQESEPYIDTPVVTPNGSLQWPVSDTSSIPASQLDTESQADAPEFLSYSQLGFSQPEESQPLAQRRSSSSILSDPPPSPTPQQNAPPGPSSNAPHHPSPLRYSVSTCRSTNPSPEQHSTERSPTQISRYHLRKRRTVVTTSPTKPAVHGRRGGHTSTTLSRPLAHTIHSAHSRIKPRTPNGSPSSRTLRTRTIAK